MVGEDLPVCNASPDDDLGSTCLHLPPSCLPASLSGGKQRALFPDAYGVKQEERNDTNKWLSNFKEEEDAKGMGGALWRSCLYESMMANKTQEVLVETLFPFFFA